MKIPPLVLNVSKIRKPVFFLAIAGLLSFGQFSSAASSCKGMQQDACSNSSHCSWINSYSTKKGKTISAYCRNKSKSGKNKAVPGSGTSVKTDKPG